MDKLCDCCYRRFAFVVLIDMDHGFTNVFFIPGCLQYLSMVVAL